MNHTHPNPLEELSPRQVAELLNAHQILLIDVREPDEYAAQRIAGALLFPLSTLDALALPPDESAPGRLPVWQRQAFRIGGAGQARSGCCARGASDGRNRRMEGGGSARPANRSRDRKDCKYVVPRPSRDHYGCSDRTAALRIRAEHSDQKIRSHHVHRPNRARLRGLHDHPEPGSQLLRQPVLAGIGGLRRRQSLPGGFHGLLSARADPEEGSAFAPASRSTEMRGATRIVRLVAAAALATALLACGQSPSGAPPATLAAARVHRARTAARAARTSARRQDRGRQSGHGRRADIRPRHRDSL